MDLIGNRLRLANLRRLLHPKSVAVIGDADELHTGEAVIHNLIEGNFKGPIVPINPHHDTICGIATYPNLNGLPFKPDLVVICTDPSVIPHLIKELAQQSIKAALLMNPGPPLLYPNQPELTSGVWHTIRQTVRECGIRVIGTGSVGVMTPSLGLNASNIPGTLTQPGSVAFISQSATVCSAVLDWAADRKMGFSHFISLGECCDVDVADLLDLVSTCPETRSVLLYLSSISDARHFMSAARSTSRNKTVIAIMPDSYHHVTGNFGLPMNICANLSCGNSSSHNSDNRGSGYDIFDAAFRRAGMLRVYEMEELFEAAETLDRFGGVKRERALILSNGKAPAMEAVSALPTGCVVKLSESTVKQLDELFGHHNWSRSNPVYFPYDSAGPETYAKALSIMMNDCMAEVVVALHAPTPKSTSGATAEAVVNVLKKSRKRNVLTCWMGGQSARAARTYFYEAHIPTYYTPCQVAKAFGHLLHYHRNQELMHQVPYALTQAESATAAKNAAAKAVRHCIGEKRTLLNEEELRVVLAAMDTIMRTDLQDVMEIENDGEPFQIDAETPDAIAKCIEHADGIGYPVRVSIMAGPGSGLCQTMHCETSSLRDGDALRAAVTRLLPRFSGLNPQLSVYKPTAYNQSPMPCSPPVITPTLSPVLGPSRSPFCAPCLAPTPLTLTIPEIPDSATSSALHSPTGQAANGGAIPISPTPSQLMLPAIQVQPFKLAIAMRTVPVFGCVIECGVAGASNDRAVGLPPLNTILAQDLVARSKIGSLLHQQHQVRELAAVQTALVKLSELTVEIPEIEEIVIDPLMIEIGVSGLCLIAGNAKVAVSLKPPNLRRLAVAPYPQEMEEIMTLRSGQTVLVRPIRPEDEPAHHAFYARLSHQDRMWRFFADKKEITHSEMQWYTQIDYDREVALIATVPSTTNRSQWDTVGWVGAVGDPENVCVEFGLVIDPAWKNQGLGKTLMKKLIQCCRQKNVKEILGLVASDNRPMLCLMKSLSFECHRSPDDFDLTETRYRLEPEESAAGVSQSGASTYHARS